MRESKKRKEAVSKFDHLYKHIYGERGQFYYLCVYCGEPASERDHVPPITRVDDYRNLHLENELFLKIPCCRECNNFGADILDDGFLSRVERIKDKIARKYSRFMSKSDWDDDEVEELDFTLKTKVLEHGKKGEIALERIEYYAGVDLVLDKLDI